MFKLNQKGVAHILAILLLLIGIAVSVYLVQNQTNLFPKASVSTPVGPETSFTLVGPTGCTAGILCLLYGAPAPGEEIAVKLYARSDIEKANLFTAKMTFPKDIVEVRQIQRETDFPGGGDNPNIPINWIENFYDNTTGEMSLVAGVPAPGYQTQTGSGSVLMATIVFRAKALGQGTVAFADTSGILSNLNNINILTVKRNYDISVEVKPAPTPGSQPAGSRIFITSTRYDGNLGGLAGADAKCQARADAANLGGTWKAWLSDSTTSASSRLIKDTGPYKLLNGTVIANGWDDLADGTIQNPININEFNQPASGTSWTHTNEYGGIFGTLTPCNNWTSVGGDYTYDLIGNYLKTDKEWTAWPSGTYCNVPQTLYCFEQPGVTIVPSPTPVINPTKGDGNNDGKINLTDISIIFSDWMKTSNMQGFRAGIDMNDDGQINTFDFGMMRNLLLNLGVIRVN